MATRSNSSRERILACAEAVILQKGFGGTSIDDILEQASITKGGFFYHFDGKPGLAEALIRRFLEEDDRIYNAALEQAAELSEDPLQRLLILLKLLAEVYGSLEETHPGCLVASFTYESQQFRDEIRELVRGGMLNWRQLMLAQLEAVSERYEMLVDMDLETLADMYTATIEGGILLARNFNSNSLLVKQLLAYRSFVRMLYGAN